MFTHRINACIIVLVFGFVLTVCWFGPPPSCGEKIGGTADTSKFDQFFKSIILVNETSLQPGPESENGMEFAQGEPLIIQVVSKSDVMLRACIQPRSGGKEIPFDKTQSIPQGQGTVNIGIFKPGSYVIRVIVDDTLIKNFPFFVK